MAVTVEQDEVKANTACSYDIVKQYYHLGLAIESEDEEEPEQSQKKDDTDGKQSEVITKEQTPIVRGLYINKLCEKDDQPTSNEALDVVIRSEPTGSESRAAVQSQWPQTQASGGGSRSREARRRLILQKVAGGGWQQHTEQLGLVPCASCCTVS